MVTIFPEKNMNDLINIVIPNYDETLKSYKEIYPLYNKVSFKVKNVHHFGYVASVKDADETNDNNEKILYIFPEKLEINPFYLTESHKDLTILKKREDVKPWIGFDFDATIAEYFTPELGLSHTGKPIGNMVGLIKCLQKMGWLVKIFTARASFGEHAIDQINIWQKKVDLKKQCPVTNIKDGFCVLVLDDRAINVIPNKGIAVF